MLWTCSFRPRQIRERNFTSIPMPALWKLGFDIQYNFEDLQRWYSSNAPIHLSGRTCSILSWNKLSSNLRAKAEEVAKKLHDDNEGWPEICLFVTYHGFAAQGEHIGRAALQGSRPNIHLRNEWQINFFMRWWLWRKGLPPCRPLPSEKFCRAQGARKQNYNLRPPLPLMLPPRNALQKMLSQIFEILTTDESFTRGEVCQQEGCISEDLPRAVVVLQDKDSLAQYPW